MAINSANELKYLSNLMNTTQDAGTKNWAWNESKKYSGAASPVSAPAAATPAAPTYGNNRTLSEYINLFGIKPVGLNTPTYAAPDPYVPDPAPQQMDWETAYSQAQAKVNPQYDTLRTRSERDYRDQREMIPQLLAARYGMAGLKGGRRVSEEADVTQDEAMGISELESQRAQATNSMASAIQSDDYSNLMNVWKAQQELKANQAAGEYQRYRDDVLDKQTSDNQRQNLLLQLLNMSREDDRYDTADNQWQQTYNLNKSNSDREFDWTTNPDNWANKLKAQSMQADIQNVLRSANQPYKTSSGGGGKTTKPTVAEEATGYIQTYMDRFKSPNDMYQQVKRNMAAGKLSYSIGSAVLSQLKTLYGTDNIDA